MHMTASFIPLGALDEVRALPGIAWAQPIAVATDSLEAGPERQLAYVIGYEVGHPGGPTDLVRGRAPGPGEIVLDDRSAERLGVGLGDEVTTAGRTWRVSGISTAMTNIVNSVAYVPFDGLAAARGMDGTASYLLVNVAGRPGEVASRIEASTGLTALPREAFSAEEARAVRDMSTELLAIMTLSAFVIALVVVGLTLYAGTLARLHEVGVMKALGAGAARLGTAVLSQALWTVAAAAVLALALALGLAWLLAAVGSSISVVIEASSVIRVAVGALVIAALGALSPLVRVLRVDPATVFRR
jgi:putative ABC transport system permease protein